MYFFSSSRNFSLAKISESTVTHKHLMVDTRLVPCLPRFLTSVFLAASFIPAWLGPDSTKAANLFAAPIRFAGRRVSGGPTPVQPLHKQPVLTARCTKLAWRPVQQPPACLRPSETSGQRCAFEPRERAPCRCRAAKPSELLDDALCLGSAVFVNWACQVLLSPVTLLLVGGFEPLTS